MNRRKLLIFSSYYSQVPADDWFYGEWSVAVANSMHAIGGVRMVTMAQAGRIPRIPFGEIIVSAADIPTLCFLEKQKEPPYCTGMVSALMAGLWMAYNDDRNFVYIEQDVLPFGAWYDSFWTDLGDGDAVFPRVKLFGPEGGSLAFFMVRHRGIPNFVRRFLDEGPERVNNVVEHIVGHMIGKHPDQFKWSSMGVERDRPIVPSDSFFVHKPTPDEMRFLADHGLVSIYGMPDKTVFSNH